MAKNKYYAVTVGRTPGLYTTWDDAKAQVEGFSGAKYKGFPDVESAAKFIAQFNSGVDAVQQTEEELPKKVYAGRHTNIFVDGSYNADTNEYGYGVYVDDEKSPKIFSGKGMCQAGGRNIEGEIQAATIALQYAEQCGKYDSVTIYHDLEHIGAIGDHKWKAGTEYTRDYGALVDKIRHNGLAVDFEHVKGHTGVQGNEYVDKLAKIGCGIPLRQGERDLINTLRNVDGFPMTRELPDVPQADEVGDQLSY